MNCTSTLLGAKLAGSFATLGTQLQGAVPPKYRFPTVPCCARYGADCSESESPYTNHWTAWGGGGVINLQPVARSPNSAKPTSSPARLRTIDRVLASAHAALAGSRSTSRFDTAGSQLEWGAHPGLVRTGIADQVAQCSRDRNRENGAARQDGVLEVGSPTRAAACRAEAGPHHRFGSGSQRLVEERVEQRSERQPIDDLAVPGEPPDRVDRDPLDPLRLARIGRLADRRRAGGEEEVEHLV